MTSRPAKFMLHVLPHGRTLEVRAGQVLLDAILAAGIAAPHSCTMGYCGSCRAGLRSGIVAYPSGQVVNAAAGSGLPDDIMLCIARPLSDVEVEIRFAQGGGPEI